MKNYFYRSLFAFMFGLVIFALATEYSGRISLRQFQIDNRLNGDLSVPAVRFRLNVSDIFSKDVNLFMYYRGEKDLEGNHLTKSRLYEMRLRANQLVGGLGLELGRINSPVVGAYGILDGICLNYQILPGLSTGGFWGAEPDLLTFQMKDEVIRTGGFFQFDYGRAYQGTISAIHQTYRDELDRLYLYFDNDLELSEKLSFSQFAEVDLKEKNEEIVTNSLHFTNVFADLRYSPSRFFNLTLSFNSRKEYKYLESMSELPDSLFDSAVSQSYGLRLNLRPLDNWRAYGNFRFGQRDDEVGWENFSYLGIANSKFFSENMFFNLRYAQNRGFYANSSSWNLSVERKLTHKLRLTTAYHQTEFVSLSSSYDSINQSVDAILVYHLSWRLYGYLKATRTWGADMNENRYFAELSYQFRDYQKDKKL